MILLGRSLAKRTRKGWAKWGVGCLGPLLNLEMTISRVIFCLGILVSTFFLGVASFRHCRAFLNEKSARTQISSPMRPLRALNHGPRPLFDRTRSNASFRVSKHSHSNSPTANTPTWIPVLPPTFCARFAMLYIYRGTDF